MRASSVVLLPHAPSSVAVARKRLSSELADSGVYESIVDDASVIVSELISNALRHARPLPSGQVRVCWLRRGDLLELEVSDGGAMTEPRRGPGTLSSLGGRGLGIVEALSEGWGCVTRTAPPRSGPCCGPPGHRTRTACPPPQRAATPPCPISPRSRISWTTRTTTSAPIRGMK
ncbi:ATP-binding protein [Actinomadura madurae]|uniref:ATP-binding protein n=1 Tax=Actinomadura madurae TaxID=1993 RepID=UPI002025E882|nr:ATP-binding protein [Actinomadura madurae]MCP9968816.1 ATP-binding protein [Actinomadura madurae]MCQ0017492.1 ATP-binding protein [Actinomadura madurae]URM97584.1 ATP-binding protein [Actinomadura madurae]